MGFLKDLKDAANRGHEEAKQKIAKKEEEERKKIEMLNEISRRRNESNKKNK